MIADVTRAVRVGAKPVAEEKSHPRGRLTCSSYLLREALDNGGEGEIRTPDSLATMSDFESGAFNRALPPLRFVYSGLRHELILPHPECAKKCASFSLHNFFQFAGFLLKNSILLTLFRSFMIAATFEVSGWR